MNVTRIVLASGTVLALAACGSSAPNKYDVSACKGVKQTVAQMTNGTVGSAGTEEEVALMGWQAIARGSGLKSDIRDLEQSLLLANPGAGSYSQLGYDNEDADIKAIGHLCSGDGVSGIADGW